MLLQLYVEEVFSLEVEQSVPSLANYRYIARAFNKFCGGQISLAEINEPLLSRFLLSRLAAQRSPTSVRNERFAMLRITDHAAERGYCRRLDRRRVRMVSAARAMPCGPRQDELRRLLAAAALPGCFANGAKRRDYFRALLLAAYETGLRKGDLFRLHREQIGRDGVVALTLHKTRQTHCCRLSKATRDGLAALPGDTPLRFPCSSQGTFTRWCAKLKKAAGISMRGLLQPIRRSAASYVQRSGGSAQEFLGHLTPGLAERYYIVPQIVREKLPPMPPRIATR